MNRAGQAALFFLAMLVVGHAAQTESGGGSSPPAATPAAAEISHAPASGWSTIESNGVRVHTPPARPVPDVVYVPSPPQTIVVEQPVPYAAPVATPYYEPIPVFVHPHHVHANPQPRPEPMRFLPPGQRRH